MFNFFKKNKNLDMIENAILTLRAMKKYKADLDLESYAYSARQIMNFAEYFEKDVKWLEAELNEQRAKEAIRAKYQGNA